MRIWGSGGIVAGLGLALVLTVAMWAPTQTRAEPEVRTGLVVVELFTSQGCSSCPPADALMHELATKDGVLPLALHVDYWDYIGWADSFARPEHTQRQRAYARAVGDRMIYTPQMIIGGQDRIVGAKGMAIMASIADLEDAARTVALDLVLGSGMLRIGISADAPVPGPLSVQIVRFTPKATVEITRGENAGRTFDYAHIVTAWDEVAQWDGAAPMEIDVDVDGPTPVAVLVQAPDHGAILGAGLVE